MKEIVKIIFSILCIFTTAVFADDIKDFEIEGISVGDSLLDFMTEDEILKEIELTKNYYSHKKEPHKYSEIYFFKNLAVYDGISFLILNNPSSIYISNKNPKNNYTIMSIRGIIQYNKNFEACLQKRDQIVEELSNIFSFAEKEKYPAYKYNGDPSGNSIVDPFYIYLASGAQIEASCYDYDEEFRINNDWTEGLSVAIDSKDIIKWLSEG